MLRICNCYSLGVAAHGYCAHWQSGILYTNYVPLATGSAYTTPVSPALGYAQQTLVPAAAVAPDINLLANSMSNVRIAAPYAAPKYCQSYTAAQYSSYPPGDYYAQQQQTAAPLTHIRDTSGLSVNVSKGAFYTESRGIHISNLDFKITQSELQRMLAKVARPAQVDLHFDGARGKANKGSAVVQFQTSEDARRVVNHFNGYKVKGKELRVRLDKNTTSVGAITHPTIINGSTGYPSTA